MIWLQKQMVKQKVISRPPEVSDILMCHRQFFDSWVLDVMVEFVTDNFGMISLSIIKCSAPPNPPQLYR